MGEKKEMEGSGKVMSKADQECQKRGKSDCEWKRGKQGREV